MRTFVSAVAVIIGLVLTAVAIPAMWVDRNIVQEDGFVAFAAPLGKDPAFQQRLAGAAVGSLGADQIPQAISGLVTPVLQRAAKSLTAMPGYPEAWTETLRKSHRLNFADPKARPAGTGTGTSLTLDLAPLVGLVANQVAEATSLQLTAPDQLPITLGQPKHRQILDRVSAVAPIGYPLAAGALISFALAFVAARRRPTVLAGIGLGALVLAGAWQLAAGAAGSAVKGTSSGNAVAEIFKSEFVSAASSSFGQWILAAAAAGGVLLAAGLILRARPHRRVPQPLAQQQVPQHR
ncbi:MULTISPECIES: hypothetical protein [unclassified Arthrobacter]|uniref:hypothetical protein n=1 Tax=unclassified Arthrobacter TaxID=235627 RepID=UPI001D0005AD|nr:MULTISPECIES: hypothetical protein [unclassified Arthrobacter]MCB5283506.1 hypothetical protein [Arthrobacter sp. ES1]WGZ78568.1 hypothetical protein QI450_11870 [Arthrobacter sp. EM1]